MAKVAFETLGLAHDTHDTITIDEGEVAWLNGTYVGKVNEVAEGAFETLELAHDAHGTIEEDIVALLDRRRRQSSTRTCT